MMADQPSQRVASKHAPADDLIKKLRGFHSELAHEIAKLGDAVEEMSRTRDELMGEVAAARVDREAAQRASDELAEWGELLEDFRRGVRDADELLERTVGKT